MADFVSNAAYEAGEIVPRCSSTQDVFVEDVRDVTIGGRPPCEWPGRVIGVFPVKNGSICIRLALDAGDRLRLKQKDDACVALVRELAEVYTVETDQVRVLALVQQARELTGYGQVASTRGDAK